jgi:hypothetical protein
MPRKRKQYLLNMIDGRYIAFFETEEKLMDDIKYFGRLGGGRDPGTLVSSVYQMRNYINSYYERIFVPQFYLPHYYS